MPKGRPAAPERRNSAGTKDDWGFLFLKKGAGDGDKCFEVSQDEAGDDSA